MRKAYNTIKHMLTDNSLLSLISKKPPCPRVGFFVIINIDLKLIEVCEYLPRYHGSPRKAVFCIVQDKHKLVPTAVVLFCFNLLCYNKNRFIVDYY